MSPKKNAHRRRSELGAYLTKLREENTTLGTAAVARELGLRNRQQLDHYEIGRTVPPAPLLVRLARLYKVHPEELLARAYWPQLILLPLVSLIDPEQLSRDLIEALEKGLEQSERQELTKRIEELLLRRSALKRR